MIRSCRRRPSAGRRWPRTSGDDPSPATSGDDPTGITPRLMFRSKEPVAWDPRYFNSTIRWPRTNGDDPPKRSKLSVGVPGLA